MSQDAWITLLVLAGTIGLLVRERVRPAVTVLGATLTLLVLGVIDEDQALSGFSNPAPFTVAALFIVAGAVERTGALEPVTERLLDVRSSSGGRPRRAELARIVLPVASASAFLNNTPVVAMVAPRLAGWARRTNRAPSHYLLPVSFAAILGGVVTTIGTSTNLVVNGLLLDDGVQPIGLFELSKAGLPVATAGLLVLLVLGRVLLVDRRATGPVTAGTLLREFTVEMRVPAGSPLVGRTVAEAGLRNLQGVFLFEIERSAAVVAPVTPQERLQAGDRLTFAGDVSRVLDLQRMGGLEPAHARHLDVTANGTRRFFEVVVSADSDLVGHTLKSTDFRNRYQAAVLAIHRAGGRVVAKLGEVVLRPGDVLLVVADPGFGRRWRDSGSFLLVSGLTREIPLRREGARITQIVLVALVALAGTGLVDILTGSLVAVATLIATRVLTVADARDCLDLSILVLIAGSFGLGSAVGETGLALQFADALTSLTAGLGDRGLLVGVLLATASLTAVINNNASAVLMWPVAQAAAVAHGHDPRAFAVAVMIAASMDFLTPFGYQTNTMVYGMGGYRFLDYPRLGLPITVATLATAAYVIPLAWPLG